MKLNNLIELIEKTQQNLKKNALTAVNVSLLKSFRQFYLSYPEIGRSRTGQSLNMVSDSGGMILQSLTEELRLLSGNSKPDISRVKQLLTAFSYTHFVELLKTDNPARRAFYESEAISGNWSVG